MSDDFDSPRRVYGFDRFGRRLLPVPGEDPNNIIPWTRATTLASTVDDMWNLQQWQLRMVAHGIGKRSDLYSLAASLDPEDDKGDLQKVCNDAMEAAEARAGANMGTALHSFTHVLDRVGVVYAPEMWRGHLDVYRRGMDSTNYSVDRNFIERVCVNTQIKTAGQFDRLLRPPFSIKGEYMIGDLKTEKGDFEYSMRRIAIQLAIYANSDFIWDAATHVYAPMPSMDRQAAIVMHLPATGPPRFQLYEVDIAAGWEAVQLALDVRTWRKRKGLMRPLGVALVGAKTVLDIENPTTGELDPIASPQPSAGLVLVGESGPELVPAAPAELPPGDGVPAPPAPVEAVSTDWASSWLRAAEAGALDARDWRELAAGVDSREAASALWRAAVKAGAWTTELENTCKKALDKSIATA